MKKYRVYIALLVVIAIISSCQKVINIDLNSVNPAIIIVGNINDQPGPYSVTLSQTVNFSDPNTFPPIDGAFVTIADNAGTIDTLAETTKAGTYNTKKIVGIPGRTYTLTVNANGQTYQSVSTMPQPINFDTLYIYAHLSFFSKGGPPDTVYTPLVEFQDPGNSLNYFRFIETKNDTLLTNVMTSDDQFSSGKMVYYPIRSEGHPVLVGDSIKVEMQCIDKGTYQYLSTLGEASGSTNVTPSNPVSNISNNALGYFSAHTSRYKVAKIN
jgi:hypothetical protein